MINLLLSALVSMGLYSGTENLNWQVGDKTSHSVSISFLKGTMDTLIREKQGNDFWLEQNIDLLIQKAKIELLIDPNTGEIKAMIVNGQKQDPPAGGNFEIIETREDRITVPAGTFDVVYIKARDTDSGQEVQQWANPSEIPVFGMAKGIQPSQMGEVVLELTSYQRN